MKTYMISSLSDQSLWNSSTDHLLLLRDSWVQESTNFLPWLADLYLFETLYVLYAYHEKESGKSWSMNVQLQRTNLICRRKYEKIKMKKLGKLTYGGRGKGQMKREDCSEVYYTTMKNCLGTFLVALWLGFWTFSIVTQVHSLVRELILHKCRAANNKNNTN